MYETVGITAGAFEMTTEMPELLPCPFCKQQVVIKFQEGQEYIDFHGFVQVSQDNYIIECRNKHTVRIHDNSRTKAVAKWNTRTDLVAAKLAAAEKMAGALEFYKLQYEAEVDHSIHIKDGRYTLKYIGPATHALAEWQKAGK